MHRFKKKLKSILHSSLICPYNIENKFYTTQSNSYRGDTYKKNIEIFIRDFYIVPKSTM